MKTKTRNAFVWIAAALLLAGMVSACKEVEGILGIANEEENNDGGGGKTSPVTKVTVTPATMIIIPDNTQQFNAAVSVGGQVLEGVEWTWTVSGNEGLAEGTGIDETTGLLTVAADETATTLTVTAEGSVPGISATVTVYTNLAAYLTAYVAANPKDGTVEKPIPLPVSMKVLTTDLWMEMLGVIGGQDKFVSLDLSACQSVIMNGDEGEFDIISSRGKAKGERIGEDKVVSVVLPEAATSIGQDAFSYNKSYGGGFTALKNFDGAGVRIINDAAFNGCSALTTVNLPAVTEIGHHAFISCTALTTLTLPENPPTLQANTIFSYTNADDPLTILVPTQGAVDSYTAAKADDSKKPGEDDGGWGVNADTAAGDNTDVYGDNHKAITIKAVGTAEDTAEGPPAAQ